MKRFFQIGVSFFFFTLSLLLLVAIRPHLIFNPWVLRHFIPKLLPRGIQLHWREMQIHLISETLLLKRIQVSGVDLCFIQANPQAKGCAHRYAVDLRVNFSGWTPQLIHPIQVDLLETQGEILTNLGQISSLINIHLRTYKEGASLSWDGDLEFKENQSFWQDKQKLKEKTMSLLQAEVQSKIHVVFDEIHHPRFQYDLTAVFKSMRSALRGEFSAEGRGGSSELTVRLKTAQLQLLDLKPWPLDEASLNQCEMSLKKKEQMPREPFLDAWLNAQKLSLQVSCPWKIHLSSQSQTMQTLKRLGLSHDLSSQKFAGRASGEIALLHPFNQKRAQANGFVTLSLHPFTVSQLRSQFWLKTYLNHAFLSEDPRKWGLNSEFDLNLKVLDLKALEQEFKFLNFWVPAPFHVLSGPIDAHLQGSSSFTQSQAQFQIKIRLHSATQELNSTAQGSVGWRRGALVNEVDMDTYFTFDDGVLELPQVSWDQIPTLLSDSRINLKSNAVMDLNAENSQNELETASSEKSNQLDSEKRDYPLCDRPSCNERTQTPTFHYTIRLMTSKKKRFALRHLGLNQKIPVSFDLRLSHLNPIAGWVEADSFPVKVFTRSAWVKRFRLDLQSPWRMSGLSGELEMRYSDYDLKIGLGATLEHPWVHLSSEPALSENQLWSILLFGRLPEELSTNEGGSVGNVRALMADQALGWFSLLALSSTPIESVSYDSESSRVIAKIRLGEGTSLRVGSDPQARATLGVQKRLGKFWVLQTEYGRTADSAEGIARAYLQWSHRY